MQPIRVKTVQESDLRMLGDLARNIQRVLPVTQADIDAAAALGKGWVVWKVFEVADPLNNLRGGTQLIIRQNSIQPGQNVRRVIFVAGPGGQTVVIRGTDYIALPDAIANSISYVKAFGGTEQRNLPDDYTELEYIESTGTQYIDTGVVPNQNYSAELVAQLTENSNGEILIGSRVSYASRGFTIVGHSSGTYWASGYGNQNGMTSVVTDLNKHTFKKTPTNFYIDGASLYTYTSETFTAPGNLYLFGSNNNGTFGLPSKLKVWSLKLYNDGTPVRDMVPVRRNSDNELGMYDTVSGQFFTNQGTGTFIAGGEAVPTPDAPVDIWCNNGVLKVRHQSGLPLGYTLLDYIKSTGTQYINTGLAVNANTRVRAEFEFTSSTSSTRRLFGKIAGVSASALNYREYVSFYWFKSNTLITSSSGKHLIEFKTDDNVYLDGTVIGTKGTFSGGSDLPMYLFAELSDGGNIKYGSVKVYRFTIFEGTAIVQDLIPCKNASNVVGMYDFVSGQFFTNQGTGDFIAGSTVSDPVEIYTDGTAETIEDTIGNTATTEMLLKVGNYQDVQSIIDGVVTRNVGIKVLDGTESWSRTEPSSGVPFATFNLALSTTAAGGISNVPRCSHFQSATSTGRSSIPDNGVGVTANSTYTTMWFRCDSITTKNDFTTWLADQYNAGTPVIILFALATPTTESVAGQTLQVTGGDNVLEITQASLDGLELEAEYTKVA